MKFLVSSTKVSMEKLLKFVESHGIFNKELHRNTHADDELDELERLAHKIQLNGSFSSCSMSDEMANMRHNLLDWLIVVLKKLKFREESYLLVVEIFDTFLGKVLANPDDLKLILISTLLIVSKYEELVPISIKQLIKEVDHGHSTKQQIMATELLILTKLRFKIPKILFSDFIYLMVKHCTESVLLKAAEKENKTKHLLRRQNCVVGCGIPDASCLNITNSGNANKSSSSILVVKDESYKTKIDDSFIKDLIYLLCISMYKLTKLHNLNSLNTLELYCAILFYSYECVSEIYKESLRYDNLKMLKVFEKLNASNAEILNNLAVLKQLSCTYKIGSCKSYFKEYEILNVVI